MSIKEEALERKMAEIQAELDEWIKNSGIFSVGDLVRFSLKLERTPVTICTDMETVRLSPPPVENPYYRYISAEISEYEWGKIIDVCKKPKHRQIAETLKSRNNTPTFEKEFYPHRGCSSEVDSFGKVLRTNGLKFVLVRRGFFSQEDDHGYIYQLWYVEPKEPVLKFWPTLSLKQKIIG